MAKILVTGGLGFLGSHLVDRLLLDGHDVTIVDNLSANVVPPAFFEERCRFWNIDIVDLQPSDHFDQIYHLANTVGSIGILPYGGSLGYKVIAGIQAILDWAVRDNASLLFVSSSDVYGRDGWLRESDPIMFPPHATVRREYAASKLLAEIMTLNSVRVKPLRANIIRPFNIAGPRQSEEGGFVIPRFIKAAISKKPLTIFGDGSQCRSFVHVSEVVDACIRIMYSQISGEVYNVGNPSNVVQIYELARMVLKHCKSDSEIQFVNPMLLYGELYDGGPSKLPIVEKIYTEIGWSPKVKLGETIEDSLVAVMEEIKGAGVYANKA